MRRVTIAEARRQFSALIDQVRNGETVLILDRDTPVARLESVAAGRPEDVEGRLERLERAGLIIRGRGKLPPDFFKRIPRAKDGASIVDAVLEEREEDER